MSYQGGTFVTARALSAARWSVILYTSAVLHGMPVKISGRGSRQADQRVAAVERRAQHHVVAMLSLTSHSVDRRAQDRAGQGGAVRVDQHRAGVARAEEVGDGLDESLAEVAVSLEQDSGSLSAAASAAPAPSPPGVYTA